MNAYISWNIIQNIIIWSFSDKLQCYKTRNLTNRFSYHNNKVLIPEGLLATYAIFTLYNKCAQAVKNWQTFFFFLISSTVNEIYEASTYMSGYCLASSLHPYHIHSPNSLVGTPPLDKLYSCVPNPLFWWMWNSNSGSSTSFKNVVKFSASMDS